MFRRALPMPLLKASILLQALASPAGGEESLVAPASDPVQAWKLNRVVVTPNGPDDGGDFGSKTPGTRTSGLQEAFDHAKATARDLYLAGGSWTEKKTVPVVYFLHETLHIPWMQNFRADSGHCVIHYAKKTGDAVVIDSQMSCSYRFGLIVSESSGATVRLQPSSAGPDRFKVITSTDFYFNALVGGGGAWPGGEAYNSELDQDRPWVGTGLCLDASAGPIDGNRIYVTEVVGCERGIHLTGPCTHNTIEATLVHLCRNHIQLGDPERPDPRGNRLQAHCESEGLVAAVGARVFARDNILNLSFGRMSDGGDVVFEPSAADNLVVGIGFPHGITNRSTRSTNRVIGTRPGGFLADTPAVPLSGEPLVNRHPGPVEVRILAPGGVKAWSQTDPAGRAQTFAAGFFVGQAFTLGPGDSVRLEYDQAPAWIWKAF